MRTLLLSPHYDDEVLFAAFTLIRWRPDIAYVFAPEGDEEHAIRRSESAMALEALGVGGEIDVTWLGAYEGAGECGSLPRFLAECRPPALFIDRQPGETYYDHVFAPWVKENGHAEHNSVGVAARTVYTPDTLTFYPTYTRTGGRTIGNTAVPCEPEWISRKLRALACFRSQIEHPARRPWFYDQIDLREFYA